MHVQKPPVTEKKCVANRFIWLGSLLCLDNCRLISQSYAVYCPKHNQVRESFANRSICFESLLDDQPEIEEEPASNNDQCRWFSRCLNRLVSLLRIPATSRCTYPLVLPVRFFICLFVCSFVRFRVEILRVFFIRKETIGNEGNNRKKHH